MESHSILGTGNLWKIVLSQTLIPVFLSEPDKHIYNQADIGIQLIRHGFRKNWNAYAAGVMDHQCNMW